ncbi:hypothetical protein GQ54DRAFT_295602 [Martensiomyces pterosporus]|nr:hypothetical protein GQ54DRAFT_295602 [Martensiomyces pterosporus]
MEPASNALLNALAAYASDEDSSSNSENEAMPEGSVSPPALQQPVEGEGEGEGEKQQEKPSADMEKDNHAADRAKHAAVGSNEYEGISDEALVEYGNTKKNLDILLGCDKVPDITPLPNDVGGCPAELQAKFKQWHDLKVQGANFNEALTRNKTFRNPNIYKWLVGHFELQETGSNFPADDFASDRLRNDFSAKALAECQEQRARRQAAAKSNNSGRKIEFRSTGYQAFSQPASTAATAPTPTPTLLPQIPAHTRSSNSGSNSNKKAFEDAVQRAKLIAQHFAQSKGT